MPITATPPPGGFPMISHLGKMPSLVVGGTWAARRAGEDVFGLVVIGDGGSSTGEIPRIAERGLGPKGARAVPHRRTTTIPSPRRPAFNTIAGKLSDRAGGYGIPGRTIDGTDAWEVYTAVCDALETMQASRCRRFSNA